MMKRLLLACCLTPFLSAQAIDFDTQEMLAARNRWRKTVGVPPLAWSAGLAASAQKWADHLREHNECRMQHSKPDGQYGENLYWGSALAWSDGRREVQKAGERADYDYRSNSCAAGKMCGHYTQVIWKTTTTIGCAVAVCEDSREQIWVCRYQPPGNWVGKRPY